MQSSKWMRNLNSMEINSEVRTILIGRTGSGKSSTGNTILDRDEFMSEFSPASVTRRCYKACHRHHNGKQITVVDTPGFFDTSAPGEEVTREISRCMALSYPGPHAFIYVIKLDRFTKEEIQAYQLFVGMFGKKAEKYTVLLFTNLDSMDGTDLHSFLSKAPKDLKDIITSYGNRIIGFDNKNRPQGQVDRLLDIINNLEGVNGKSIYSNAMYEEQKAMIKRQTDRMKREMEIKEKEKIKAFEDKISAKCEQTVHRAEKDLDDARDCTRRHEKQISDLQSNLARISSSSRFNQHQLRSTLEDVNRQIEDDKQRNAEEKKRFDENHKRDVERLQREHENQMRRIQDVQRQNRRREPTNFNVCMIQQLSQVRVTARGSNQTQELQRTIGMLHISQRRVGTMQVTRRTGRTIQDSELNGICLIQ